MKSWATLAKTHPSHAARIRFNQVGESPPWLRPMMSFFGLEDRLIEHGQVPHQQVSVLMETFDVLLATALKRHDVGDYFLASKTFDYLRARKPILSFCPQGSQHSFLTSSGIAITVDPDNEQEGAEALFDLLKNPHYFELNAEFVNHYQRSVTAQFLARLLNELPETTSEPSSRNEH